MSKEKGKRFDMSHVSEYEFDIEPDPDAASATPNGFDFVEITSRPMSKKNRKAAEAAAAKAAIEAQQKAEAEARKRVVEERQRLLTLFPQFAPKPVLPTPRPSVHVKHAVLQNQKEQLVGQNLVLGLVVKTYVQNVLFPNQDRLLNLSGWTNPTLFQFGEITW